MYFNMRLIVSLLFIKIIILSTICLNSAVSPSTVHYMEKGDTVEVGPKNSVPRRELNIFCHRGIPKGIVHMWLSVTLHIDHPSNDFTHYEGPNEEVVEKEHVDNHFSWSLNIFSGNKRKMFKLEPFNTSCIGIDTSKSYSVHLDVIRLDLWKLLLLVTGIIVFMYADKLSCNTTFHYLCGIAFGICASFLILVYLVSKMFPKKTFMYGIMGCGWTVVIYILQMLWDNLRLIISSYRLYVMWYTIATGILSFILCYRWGPIENPRTINIIKWFMQFVGLACIYKSSDYQEAAMGQIVILLMTYNLPQKWVAAPKTYWFASFIEGESHLSDDEILEYETSIRGEMTEEEDDDITEDSEEC
ncbi:unnamed protein product [Acanthoscelides obtectus]|uniref:Nuclear envelope integral membrane protein 1 n=1 Tax=Acanthoscelides obtectus TaxID=200917 RepID=A0A9P0PTG0_ACAOB|nr:unnamed protein product [Acanthoscelides obtectus]CAK1663092.1 Nuclear envelope integral membrane protein 1 [Acanthoscelides obtectus]